MSEQQYDNLVIGGGISGLGMAHLSVKNSWKTALLEKDAQVGGCIHSHAFDDSGDFWIELGSHTCYNSYGNLLGMVDDLGLDSRLKIKQKVSFKLLDQGRLAKVTARLRPFELAMSLPRLLTTDKSANSVEDFYSRVLGRKNYQDLFRHAFNAVICQEAGEVPADKLFRRKPRRKDRPRSFTLPGGLSSITRALAAQPGLELHTSTAVERIERQDDGFLVTSQDQRQWRSRRLSVALNPDQSAALLKPAFPETAAELEYIQMVSIESLAVVVSKQDLGADPLAGIIAPDDNFYSAVSRDYLDHPDYRGLCFHFKPGKLSTEAKIGRICEVLAIEPAQIRFSAERLNRLPALRMGHDSRMQKLDQSLAGTHLSVCGNFFLGVSIEDCLARSAAEFARLRQGM